MSITLADYLETEEKAEEILDILAKYNVFKPPVPTGIIFKIMPYATVDVQNMSEEVLGFSFFENGKSHILINAKLPYGAKRFTAFHEFYHLLHGQHGYSKDSPQAKDEDGKAEFFAACMLMPARWFRKYWEQVQDIDAMVEIFGVSRKAVEVRLRSLEHYLATNR
jgi:Zn-dependent peptidase ImmA (M78 family)